MSPKKIGIHPTTSELNTKEKGLGTYSYQGLIIFLNVSQTQAGQEKNTAYLIWYTVFCGINAVVAEAGFEPTTFGL